MTGQTTSEEAHVLEVNTTQVSKIVNVSLYSAQRAEITRRYDLQLRAGQNQVTITNLPNVMDRQSVRVEGRGSATIHDVTIAPSPPKPAPTTSPQLVDLQARKATLEKSLERQNKQLNALEGYLKSISSKDTPLDTVTQVLEKYETSAGRIHDAIFELEASKKNVEDEIEAEKKRLATSGQTNSALGMQAKIGVYAAEGGLVELVLIYAVRSAWWSAGYDIRVSMQKAEKPVELIYKAAITQSTGEDWNDVPLTLETATPTFGLHVPELSPWRLSIFKPIPPPPAARPLLATFAARSSAVQYKAAEEEESDEDMGFGLFDDGPPSIQVQSTAVTSTGSVTATFRVPGLSTVPSDGNAHNVTIAKLQLDATMQWVGIPKKETRMHLKAQIKNASEYTFLPGTASVYLDGSFISQSNVPSVSPQESFGCPLGVDPSIRLTYHPQSKKVTKSGFYTKTATHFFSQRITVQNTKSQPVDNITILEHVPVSEDGSIVVKVSNPALSDPTASTVKSAKGVAHGVEVEKGVRAQWHGEDKSALGKDGKLKWVCSIPAMEKVNLLLEWEVTAPADATVTGL